MSDQPQFALRFISGKYQGGEFPLKRDSEVVIGRSSDLDMVLVEDMVSRKHAKILTRDDEIVIQDLGSTNGTFVNGEKIKRVRLSEGDRILIGTSIVKLVAAALSATETPRPQISEFPSEDAPPGQALDVKRTAHSARSMAGTIDEIPLPDLLQLLSTSRKSGVLEIQTADNVGHIYLRDGHIYYATIEGDVEIAPLKAVYRMLVWESGAFELQPPDQREIANELQQPTEGLLMEAMRHLDEIRRMADDLPPENASLRIVKPLETPLKELKPAQLDLLQLVLNHEIVRRVVDHGAAPDLDVYTGLLGLIKAKVITPE